MSATRYWKVGSVLLALGASASGVVSLAGKGAAVGQNPADDAPARDAPRPDAAEPFVVKPGKLRVVAQQRGSLEASKMETVLNAVEGPTTILSIVPEGTRVMKGQVVCELDSSFLKDALANQVVAVKAAEAAYRNETLAREVAEIAVKEYEDGVYPRDHSAALGEVALARTAATRAEDRLRRTKTARARLDALTKGRPATPADVLAGLDVDDRLDAAEQALARERLALEAGQTRLNVLEKYTRDRTLKSLRRDLEEARSRELSRQSAWKLEASKVAKLDRQIAACKVVAPADGAVVYANDPNRPGGQRSPRIEPGATVVERQVLFFLPDLGRPLRVNAKVREAIVDQVRPGLRARIKVDFLPGQTFGGVVEAVAPLPDPNTFFNAGLKVYTTRIAIEDGPPSLRPGMTAEVEILIAELDDVLSVPVGAVARFDDKDQVAVKAPGGAVEWREVTLGRSNDTVVEVKAGLKAGETVLPAPGSLLSDEQKKKAARSPTRPAGAPQP